MSAEEMQEEIRKLCFSALVSSRPLHDVFHDLVAGLGKLTGDDYWGFQDES